MTCFCCRRLTDLCELLEYGRCEDCWVLTFFNIEDKEHLTEGQKASLRFTGGGSYNKPGNIRTFHSVKSTKGRSITEKQ